MYIRLEKDFYWISIYINDVLHVLLDRSMFIGIQSWLEGDDKYVIEYYFKEGASITTEYNSKDKFEFILRELDSLLRIKK